MPYKKDFMSLAVYKFSRWISPRGTEMDEGVEKGKEGKQILWSCRISLPWAGWEFC